MAEKMKRKRTKKEKMMIGISVAVMVISVVTVVVLLLMNTRLFSGENGEVNNDESILGAVTDKNGNSVTEKPSQTGKKQENFLLCGLDESEMMTDIIMVVCVDYEKNSANILQIPRDTYVAAGVGSTNKINSAYSAGDKNVTPINRLIKVINDQYQLKIDHYATVTISSFRKIIDAIGGVPIDMPYQIGNMELGIIPKGKQVLDGEHAEWLVRHRHTYYDQDIGRIKIQRLFLASAMQQAQKIGLKEVTKLIPAVYGNLTTDLTVNDMTGYVGTVLNLDMSNIHVYMIPGEGVTYKGQSVWTAHYNETADMLNAYFRPYTDKVTVDKLNITELAHTGNYYENTEDDFGTLIDGAKPGEKKEDEALPTYDYIVTQPKPVTTPTTPPIISETTAVSGTTAVSEKTTETTPIDGTDFEEETQPYEYSESYSE
ncbi:MAG: LCP family protein [Oscillospiraceae bacterium]